MPITVYTYEVHTAGRTVPAWTFEPGSYTRPFGAITGPAGTEVAKVGGRHLLKVPRVAGKPHDCLVLAARDAIDEARQGHMGLKWSDAPAGVAT